MAEEELQQQVEELRKKQELEEKLSKLRRQQEELERERREVQDLLRGFAQGAGGHHPRRARGARRVSQPRQASALDLRIDGKSLSSATPSQRSAASTRPSTAAPSFSARPAATVQRYGEEIHQAYKPPRSSLRAHETASRRAACDPAPARSAAGALDSTRCRQAFATPAVVRHPGLHGLQASAGRRLYRGLQLTPSWSRSSAAALRQGVSTTATWNRTLR